MAFDSGLQTGVLPLLQSWLGASLRKRKRPVQPPLSTPPLALLFSKIEANLSPTRGIHHSTVNWRFTTEISLRSARPINDVEKVLEKRMAGAFQHLGSWANQVPTCSGYSNSNADRKRCIDLVECVAPGHFKFVELKIASNNPVHAAAEVLLYGLTYLLARKKGAVWHGAGHQILTAHRVDLVVLAPESFYRGYNRALLHQFADLLSNSLGDFVKQQHGGFVASFRYETLPSEIGSMRELDDAGRIHALVAGIGPLTA